MFQAQVLNAGSKVFGPWMPRKSDYLIATADLVAISAGTLTVRLFTKNEEDTGEGTEVDSGTTISLSSAGRGNAEWGPSTGTGLEELVRFKFECSVSPGAWIVFRMLQPVWFDAVKA